MIVDRTGMEADGTIFGRVRSVNGDAWGSG